MQAITVIEAHKKMRFAGVLLCAVCASAADNTLNVPAQSTSVDWYSDAREWSLGRFPRVGDVAHITGSGRVVIKQSSKPAYMQGSTEGSRLHVNGNAAHLEVRDLIVIGVPEKMPQHCGVAAWGSWSSCSKECGTGDQSRSRKLTAPRYGGNVCPTGSASRKCNTHPCRRKCSHTSCKYIFRTGEWRTVVMHSKCSEKHGEDYHCEHHFGAQKVTLQESMVAHHKDECVCYCDFEGSSTIAHRHITGDANTSLLDRAHRNLKRRVAHVGNGALRC